MGCVAEETTHTQSSEALSMFKHTYVCPETEQIIFPLLY